MRSIAMLFIKRMRFFHILFQSFFLLFFQDLIAKKTVDPLELFRNWDINRNGVLSRDELPNYAIKNFNKVDIDNDHLISIDEHLSYLGKDFSKNKNFKFIYDLPYADSNNPRQTLDLIIPTKLIPKIRLFLSSGYMGVGGEVEINQMDYLPIVYLRRQNWKICRSFNWLPIKWRIYLASTNS